MIRRTYRHKETGIQVYLTAAQFERFFDNRDPKDWGKI